MSAPNFVGHPVRECGEHRTVGAHRAWCHDCSEWCYPDGPCKGCELPALRAEPSAADLWAWLLACTLCGRPHEYRQTRPGEQVRDRWTWADPDDGHGYTTRGDLGPRIARLRDAWADEQARRAADELTVHDRSAGYYDVEIPPCGCGRAQPCRHCPTDGEVTG